MAPTGTLGWPWSHRSGAGLLVGRASWLRGTHRWALVAKPWVSAGHCQPCSPVPLCVGSCVTVPAVRGRGRGHGC